VLAITKKQLLFAYTPLSQQRKSLYNAELFAHKLNDSALNK
jgi:hypothetical protein